MLEIVSKHLAEPRLPCPGGFPGGFGLQYLMPFTPPEPLNINDQSVTSLLKNCSGEASPFPPALAVVVSPGLKDVVDKMEGSSGPTKFLGLFDSSF